MFSTFVIARSEKYVAMPTKTMMIVTIFVDIKPERDILNNFITKHIAKQHIAGKTKILPSPKLKFAHFFMATIFKMKLKE